MKKLIFPGFILLSLSGLSSCTDQMTEEVKNKETLTSEDALATKYINKSIRLVNKGDDAMSYILHKAGSLQEACELKSPTMGFSSLDYDKTSSAYTTDCILDAQEYDFFFSGAKFEIQVDENLCEYVKYKPFRFFQHAPGTSHQTVYELSCDAECGTQYPTYCGKKFRTSTMAANTSSTYDPTGVSGLNVVINSSTQVTTVEEAGYCHFDYSNDGLLSGPNCDQGKVTTQKYELTSTEYSVSHCDGAAGGDQATCSANTGVWVTEDKVSCSVETTGATEVPASTTFYPKLSFTDTEQVKCGGNHASCLAGPGADELEAKYNGTIVQNLDLAAYTEEKSLSSPIEKGHSTNMYIANFSRICSSTSNTKIDSQFDTTLTSIIGHEVEDMPSRDNLTPYKIDWDGNGTDDYTVYGYNAFNAKGYYSSPTNNVNPYYAIECLDQARDVKAQIRLFIREWDRDFTPSNPYIERLSDINQTTPIMDSGGDQAPGEPWNDKRDWDDFFGDYDFDSTFDADGDGDNVDKWFTDNQCSGMDIGVCSNVIYTNQATCELNSETWTTEGFENSMFPGFGL